MTNYYTYSGFSFTYRLYNVDAVRWYHIDTDVNRGVHRRNTALGDRRTELASAIVGHRKACQPNSHLTTHRPRIGSYPPRALTGLIPSRVGNRSRPWRHLVKPSSGVPTQPESFDSTRKRSTWVATRIRFVRTVSHGFRQVKRVWSVARESLV